MASLAERYEAGERVEAWADAVAHADRIDPAEVAELADLTMARVAGNLAFVVVRLTALGYRFGSCYSANRRLRTIRDLGLRDSMERAGRDMTWVDQGERVESVMGWAGPAPDVADRIAAAEAALGQDLPAALRALYTHVDQVNLAGSFLAWDPSAYDFDDDLDWPAFGLLTEPLNLLPVEGVLDHLDPDTGRIDALHLEPGGGFALPVANGAELSANRIGGLIHTVLEPPGSGPGRGSRARPDPVLRGVAGHDDITLVAHLRRTFAWGGFPGFEQASSVPPEIDRLRRDLLPI